MRCAGRAFAQRRPRPGREERADRGATWAFPVLTFLSHCRRCGWCAVIPLATQLLLPVLTKYGFGPGEPGGGVMGLLSALKAHGNNAEIAAAAVEMKRQFLPAELEPLIMMMMG